MPPTTSICRLIGNGCVLVITMPVTEIAAAVWKLEKVGMQAHSELPGGEGIGRAETGSVFVPFADLSTPARCSGWRPSHRVGLALRLASPSAADASGSAVSLRLTNRDG